MMTMIIEKRGHFYTTLAKQNDYDLELKNAMKQTVVHLLEQNTTLARPGMLLGNIQSGKTRAFIGVMSLAFDNGYDIAIILTKGTKALAHQTYQRLKKEFYTFQEQDELQVYDIMHLPDFLVAYELNQKLIFVVKKQKQNLERLYETLFEEYPALGKRKTLIIDDEADYASIGFEKTNRETTEIRTIAGQLDNIRNCLMDTSLLQVTATPYSLYLQPENLQVHEHKRFQPIRPAFTSLVPIPDQYVGGDFYFKESDEEYSLASYVYEPILSDELVILKKEDRRRFKVEHALTSHKVQSLRRAIVQFIVGTSIRRRQQRRQGEIEKKYSFIMHTQINKATHEWQRYVVESMVSSLQYAAQYEPDLITPILEETYHSICCSLEKTFARDDIPSFQQVHVDVLRALSAEYLLVTTVNSEKQVEQLLNEQGELRLRTPMTIFIGGQILDRGITVQNLVGFYYGRNPKTFQQDTVLQHSRMYGYRDRGDLAITRFYTTPAIYETMKQINEMDSALRSAFESGGHKGGIVFIQKDAQDRIIPCSPNKLLLSKTTTLKPSKRMLPVGFQTGYKTYIQKHIKAIDSIVEGISEKTPVLLPVEKAVAIIKRIADTIYMEEGYTWNADAMIAAMKYLSYQSSDPASSGYVWIIVRRNRTISRYDQNGRFISAPDTPGTGGGEAHIAREKAITVPALILLKQKGEKEKGWMDAPFWWPVLMTPQETEPAIFANEVGQKD
ncbi:Z1 domain-containing protein [Pontibacillus salicampi]|uniref:Z1 domain-containing protein n=1 Tax=Pontibacillus salicampi TaxID=1449801 RepID=A0ABV6LKS0_9BACI